MIYTSDAMKESAPDRVKFRRNLISYFFHGNSCFTYSKLGKRLNYLLFKIFGTKDDIYILNWPSFSHLLIPTLITIFWEIYIRNNVYNKFYKRYLSVYLKKKSHNIDREGTVLNHIDLNHAIEPVKAAIMQANSSLMFRPLVYKFLSTVKKHSKKIKFVVSNFDEKNLPDYSKYIKEFTLFDLAFNDKAPENRPNLDKIFNYCENNIQNNEKLFSYFFFIMLKFAIVNDFCCDVISHNKEEIESLVTDIYTFFTRFISNNKEVYDSICENYDFINDKFNNSMMFMTPADISNKMSETNTYMRTKFKGVIDMVKNNLDITDASIITKSYEKIYENYSNLFKVFSICGNEEFTAIFQNCIGRDMASRRNATELSLKFARVCLEDAEHEKICEEVRKKITSSYQVKLDTIADLAAFIANAFDSISMEFETLPEYFKKAIEHKREQIENAVRYDIMNEFLKKIVE